MPPAINELEVLVNKINMAFYQLRLLRNDIQTYQNYHHNTIPIFEAARARLESVKAMYAQLASLVEANKESLAPAELIYAEGELVAIGRMIQGFDLASSIPQITVEEAQSMILRGVVTEVEDGDTILVDGRKVRLVGIDSPEIGTERGQIAQKYVEELCLGKSVEVFIDPHTPICTYARILGVVRLPDGTILNRDLLQNCLAAPDFKGKHRFVDQDLWKKDAEHCKAAAPGFGMVSIYSNPTQSAVWVDGVNIYRTTPTKVELPLGVHDVMVVAPDHSPQSQLVDVTPGVLELKFFLKPAHSQLGFIQLVSDPLGAFVFVDGEPKGITPLLLSLPADVDAEVTLELEGFQTKTVTVAPILGVTYTVEETLLEL